MALDKYYFDDQKFAPKSSHFKGGGFFAIGYLIE